jgi:hypothetical protein
MVTGQRYGMGIGGCNKLCPAATGHSWVALFPCPCQLRIVRCMDPGQVIDLLSRAHTCLWEREDLLLWDSSSFRIDWLETEIGGGLSTALRPGLKCGGLESKFGRGPGTRDRSGTGWSRLYLGCKRGVCFSGYSAGHIDSRIAVSMWRYDLTTLWYRSKKWRLKDEDIVLIAQPWLIID